MKEFGTLYVFELKKILGQRLVLVSLLLGAAMIFGWNLLTFSSTGYYYNVYNAQDGTVERQIANYGAVEAMGRDYLRGLSGQLLDDALMEQLAAEYADSDTGTILSNLGGYSPFSYLNTMLGQEVTAQRFYRDKVRRFEVNQEECLLTDQEMAYWQGKASSLGPLPWTTPEAGRPWPGIPACCARWRCCCLPCACAASSPRSTALAPISWY